MAGNAYLTLKGQKQGDIRGSVTEKGRENSILVIAAQHGVTSLRDAASGLSTGKRMHKAFVITKELDKSTPLLYNALVNNESIIGWELKFFSQLTATAQTIQNYVVRLTNANISDIEFTLPNTTDPILSKAPTFENVSFTYQKIEWVWTEGGMTATDTWGT